jgi:hypothetical protein
VAPATRRWWISASIATLGVALGAVCWRGLAPQIRTVTWLTMGVVFGACSATVAFGSRAMVRQRLAVVVGLLLGDVALKVLRACDRWPFEIDLYPDPLYAALLACAGLAAAIGLVFRMLWARWIALAFGAAGIACGVCGLLDDARLGVRGEPAWLHALLLVGGATVWSQLRHPSVRELVGRNDDEIWSSPAPAVRLSRAAAIAGLPAAAMLVLYGLADPIVPGAAVPALVLAPVIAIGSALVIARKAVGVLILGAAGLALVALAVAVLASCPGSRDEVAAYFALFWLPAGLLGLAAPLVLSSRWGARG